MASACSDTEVIMASIRDVHQCAQLQLLRRLCVANSNVVYADERIVLITYEPRHVKRYHEWMCDAETRRMTCSEELSLPDEYDTRAQWAQHGYCGTFLIMSVERFVATAGDEMAALVGDCNFVQYHEYVELLIMIGDVRSRGRGFARAAVQVLIAHIARFIGERRRVRAILRADNTACARLLESLGFLMCASEDGEVKSSNGAEDLTLVLSAEAQRDMVQRVAGALVYRDKQLSEQLVGRALAYVDELNK